MKCDVASLHNYRPSESAISFPFMPTWLGRPIQTKVTKQFSRYRDRSNFMMRIIRFGLEFDVPSHSETLNFLDGCESWVEA